MSPLLAYAAAAGFALLVLLTALTERSSSRAWQDLRVASAERNTVVESKIRSANAIAATGMQDAVGQRFQASHDRLVEEQTRANDAVGSYAAISRMTRLALQSAIVGLGAYLAIAGDITGGAIIAASIGAGRAMAPIEQAIGHWRAFVASRTALRNLHEATALVPVQANRLALGKPHGQLSVERISVPIPGTNCLALTGIDLSIPAGTAVGVTGTSAAGKSSLARALVGIWPAARGSIRLDGAALDRWTPADLGGGSGRDRCGAASGDRSG